MRFKKVMLIVPASPGSHYEGAKVRPKAGIGYISESLTANGIGNSVIDMEIGYNLNQVISKIKEVKPDLLGMRMMTFRYKYSYSLLKRIKDEFPELKIIVGGPHMSLMRNEVLKGCDSIDFGSVMEGEKTIVELCKGNKLETIKGLLFRKNGDVIYNGDRDFIENLDEIPFPKYGKFELEKYSNSINIVTSRGCPYNCIYCPVSLAIGKKFRHRSAKNVVDELEYWHTRGYRYFEFVDDNFTLLPERVFEICDEIESRKLGGLRLSCGNGVRADRVDGKLLKRMKEVGFYLLAFGIESGSENVLLEIKKGERLDHLEKAVKSACDLGFRVELFFLLGSKGETYEDVKKSFRFAWKYPVSRVNFYNIVPFPHTELYDWIDKNDSFIVKPEEYLDCVSGWVKEPVYLTPTMTLEERVKALKNAWVIRRKIEERYFRIFLKAKGVPEPFRGIIAAFYSRDYFKNLLARMGVVEKIKGVLNY